MMWFFMKKYGCRNPLLIGLLCWGGVMMSGCSGSAASNARLLNAATAAGRAGEWDKCGKLALEVLDDNPGEPSALILLALAAERTNRMDLAIDSARKAAEQHPENFIAQYTLGRLLAAQPNRDAEAIVPLRRALKLRHQDRNTLLLAAQCAGRLNLDETMDYYRALPLDIQSRPEVQNQIAIYYVTRRAKAPGNLRLAADALANAVRADAENPRIVLNKALFLDYYAGNKSMAVAAYKQYLQLTEHNPELNVKRAQLQARIGELTRRRR